MEKKLQCALGFLCLMLGLALAPAMYGQVAITDDFQTDPFDAQDTSGDTVADFPLAAPGAAARWGFNQKHAAEWGWLAPNSPRCADAGGLFNPIFRCDTPAPANFPCTAYTESQIEDLDGANGQDQDGTADGDPSTFGLVILAQGKDQSTNIYLEDQLLLDNIEIVSTWDIFGGCRTSPNPADGGGFTFIEVPAGNPGAGSGGGSNGLTGYLCPPDSRNACTYAGEAGEGNDTTGDTVGDGNGGQQIIFEFDVNGGNAGDGAGGANEDHIGIYYTPTGAIANVPPPIDVGATIFTPNLLHLRVDVRESGSNAPFTPNRFRLKTLLRGDQAAAEFATLDRTGTVDGGTDFGRVVQTTLTGLTAFTGTLVCAGATGGRSSGFFLHDIAINTIADPCDLVPPPAIATHVFRGTEDDDCGDFVPGDRFGVDVVTSAVRDDAACPNLETEYIVNLPLGFLVDGVPVAEIDGTSTARGTVSNPSGADRATVQATVSYTFSPAEIAQTPIMRFNVLPDYPPGLPDETDFTFTTTYEEGGSGTVAIADRDFVTPLGGIDLVCGGITCWNIVGPFRNPLCPGVCSTNGGEGGAATPIDHDRMFDDFMAHDESGDGVADTTDDDFAWAPGKLVNTQYNPDANYAPNQAPPAGKSQSPGLYVTPANPQFNQDTEANPRPTVVGWSDPDSFINLAIDVWGGRAQGAATTVMCYVYSDAARDVVLKADSSKVFGYTLNGRRVIDRRENCHQSLTNCRARSSACGNARNAERSHVPAAADVAETPIDETLTISLEEGENRLVGNIYGDNDIFTGKYDFWFRFQDNFGDSVGILPGNGIDIRITEKVAGAGWIPGDLNGDENMDISDAVNTLGFLFGGATSIANCLTDGAAFSAAGETVANFNGDAGGVDISDVIAMLNFLFAGGPSHSAGENCALVDVACDGQSTDGANCVVPGA
ncbi:MAG: hypothetical protein MK538_03860 [Planctomycetes bacterium]|nr:hypothetical protein [Planctomycetota bacterium]